MGVFGQPRDATTIDERKRQRLILTTKRPMRGWAAILKRELELVGERGLSRDEVAALYSNNKHLLGLVRPPSHAVNTAFHVWPKKGFAKVIMVDEYDETQLETQLET